MEESVQTIGKHKGAGKGDEEMKKAIFFLTVIGVLLGSAGIPFAQSSVKKTPLVKVAEHKGAGDAYIGPEFFPDFYKNTNYRGGEEGCLTTLANLSGQKMAGLVNKAGFLESSGGFLTMERCRWSCYRGDITGKCNVKDDCLGKGIDIESGRENLKTSVDDDDYYDLEELDGEIEIGAGYEKTSKVLFSWSVRVEGQAPQDCDHFSGDLVTGISVWPVLCHPWRGTSYQNYEGGQVKTQLYILGAKAGAESKEYKDTEGYVAVGKPLEMTIPKVNMAMAQSDWTPPPPPPPSDPTLTGSYIVEPGSFPEGKLPAKISYKLKWSNHTALRIKSPGGQRSLIVTLLPITSD